MTDAEKTPSQDDEATVTEATVAGSDAETTTSEIPGALDRYFDLEDRYLMAETQEEANDLERQMDELIANGLTDDEIEFLNSRGMG